MKYENGVKDYSQTNPRPMFYAILLADFRRIALECGYALALHGSMMRDLDMIAVAWVETAVEPDVLVEKLCAAAATTMFEHLHPKKGDKPHGRICYTLSICKDWFIDLSVIPPRKDE